MVWLVDHEAICKPETKKIYCLKLGHMVTCYTSNNVHVRPFTFHTELFHRSCLKFMLWYQVLWITLPFFCGNSTAAFLFKDLFARTQWHYQTFQDSFSIARTIFVWYYAVKCSIYWYLFYGRAISQLSICLYQTLTIFLTNLIRKQMAKHLAKPSLPKNIGNIITNNHSGV